MYDLFALQWQAIGLNILSTLYVFSFHYGTIISAIAGLFLPTLYFDKPDKGRHSSVFRNVILMTGWGFFFFGTLANFTIPPLMHWYQHAIGMNETFVRYSIWQFALIPVFLISMIVHFFCRRELDSTLNQLRLQFTKKTKAEREMRTDVRTVRDLLPETLDYDPEQYIDLDKGVFVGLDIQHEPQYIPLNEFQKQHCDILGTTGAGKGVACGLILYQLILADEGVFVLDPKNDEWAPHLMKLTCERAGKPFHLINLNEDQPQLNLLAETTPDQIEELLVAGFSFGEKGDVADFYRIDDRKAARKAPRLASDDERKTLAHLFKSDYVQSLDEVVKAFFGKMEEMACVTSINAPNGLNLNAIFNEGGCCYVIGSLRNSKIIIAQKMILIRLLQLAEMRDRINSKPRPIAIFLDELKYHISKAAMEGLGAARDKGVHMLLAHQSVADLRDCPADLNADAVVGAVVENTKFKLVYKLQDPETAKWVAAMSGTILVDDETRIAETTTALSEIIDDKRTIRQAERNYVDSNMLMFLPPFVSYIFTATDTPRPSLIAPIKVNKTDLKIYSCAEKENTKAESKTPKPTKNINEPDNKVPQNLRADDNPSSTESETPKAIENVNEPDNTRIQNLRADDNASSTEGKIPNPTKNVNEPNNEVPQNLRFDDTVEKELLDKYTDEIFEEN
ncbi:type IV secretory system conjugative DNA transfer family protein [Photobacterium leiognathi]|uniref:type IV secretory system conjugative DNA transfer family protein n=1 Tax=Photobacterium leiognathi TaxID=553611 RepID=UPI002980FE99|nr:type IV secretion system DNA-binding domain-containing protein [Photobacterium leiognathi]